MISSFRKTLYSLIGVLYLLTSTQAWGGWVTELGGGYTVPSVTSYVLHEECKKVIVIDPVDSPRGPWFSYSCGGHGPLAIGWPIAYDFDKTPVRIGWYHMSHWFDNQGETQLNCLCATYTIRWGK